MSRKRLVFIDESFCKTGMRREYGWSRRGIRVTGTRPGRSWKTLSLIGAIRLGKRPLLMTNQGAVNGAIFLRFVRTRLLPWLRRGDVVFLDNLNIHKMLLVREAIRSVGATPIYLPTYSPELNPIELLWAHVKRGLRTAGCDTVELLGRAVRRERSRTPLAHIEGWFRRARSFAQGK